MDYLGKKRLQERVMYHLNAAFENSGEVAQESFEMAMEGLDDLKEDYTPQNEPVNEEVTMVSLLQDLVDYSTTESIVDRETGEEITRLELQDLVFQKVEQLADLLGVEIN